MIHLRLAKYDTNGDEVRDTDVLTEWEIAEDLGWIPHRREYVEIDPGLVAQVTELQRRAS